MTRRDDDRPTVVVDDSDIENEVPDEELDDYSLKGLTRRQRRETERFAKGLELEKECVKPLPLQELHLNLLGKMFLTAVGAWVIGKATNLKLRGTPQEINAVANALKSSRKFQDELAKPGATVQSVMEKLRVKNMSAREFERVFGVKWPL